MIPDREVPSYCLLGRRVAGNELVMRQPAWDNNLWGYDTIEKPFHPELSHLYLTNALELISQPGQWYLDSSQGKLYLRPPDGVDINNADVELPRLDVLVSISGTVDEPVHDLSFRSIRFSYSSWLGPSGDEGYPDQQTDRRLEGKTAADQNRAGEGREENQRPVKKDTDEQRTDDSAIE